MDTLELSDFPCETTRIIEVDENSLVDIREKLGSSFSSGDSGLNIQNYGKIVLNMTGGTIRNNKSSGNGGAIFIAPGSTVSMTGGTISGNASSGIGGGIYLEYTNEDNYGVLRLSGNPSFGEGNYQKVGEGYTAINGGEVNFDKYLVYADNHSLHKKNFQQHFLILY